LKKQFIFFVLIFIICIIPANAMQSIGTDKPEIISNNPNDIRIENWIGKKFLILELNKTLSQMGSYANLHYKFNKKAKKWHELPYKDFVNKILVVINVQKMDNNFYDHLVTFREEQSGEIVFGESFKESIDHIMLLDDLNKAKEKWLNKIIYAQTGHISTYDAQTGNENYLGVKVKIGEPLKVVNVIPAFEKCNPIWIIVKKNNGQQGFYDLAFSHTNQCSDWDWNSSPYIPFFEVDPRKTHPWGDDVWDIIAEQKIRIGWDKEKVKMSWSGRGPKEINKTIAASGVEEEQWIYDHDLLYFEKDILTAIQDY
jgi:hypothetical protein